MYAVSVLEWSQRETQRAQTRLKRSGRRALLASSEQSGAHACMHRSQSSRDPSGPRQMPSQFLISEMEMQIPVVLSTTLMQYRRTEYWTPTVVLTTVYLYALIPSTDATKCRLRSTKIHALNVCSLLQ